MTDNTTLSEDIADAVSELSKEHSGVGFLIVAVKQVDTHDLADVLSAHNMPDDVLDSTLAVVSGRRLPVTEVPKSGVLH